MFQSLPGSSREPPQFPGHEVYHVVGEALGPNLIDIPLPGCRDRIEGDQPLFGQRAEELDSKERISSSLFLHQLRKWPGPVRLAMKRIQDQLIHIVDRK